MRKLVRNAAINEDSKLYTQSSSSVCVFGLWKIARVTRARCTNFTEEKSEKVGESWQAGKAEKACVCNLCNCQLTMRRAVKLLALQGHKSACYTRGVSVGHVKRGVRWVAAIPLMAFACIRVCVCVGECMTQKLSGFVLNLSRTTF